MLIELCRYAVATVPLGLVERRIRRPRLDRSRASGLVPTAGLGLVKSSVRPPEEVRRRAGTTAPRPNRLLQASIAA
ncbi:hypothetical protein, partial [Methylobacterium mesophilicum]|uniref:hypothetical protein n=1 Tax=Methylobacterium mesophilicum TaxID=39956 RepID=UPI001EE26493